MLCPPAATLLATSLCVRHCAVPSGAASTCDALHGPCGAHAPRAGLPQRRVSAGLRLRKHRSLCVQVSACRVDGRRGAFSNERGRVMHHHAARIMSSRCARCAGGTRGRKPASCRPPPAATPKATLSSRCCPLPHPPPRSPATLRALGELAVRSGSERLPLPGGAALGACAGSASPISRPPLRLITPSCGLCPPSNQQRRRRRC